MKKILAIILTISFVLCLVPVTFSVSAAETKLNNANKGWKVTRGGSCFYTDENREFYWKADTNGRTYDWPAVHNGSLESGVITATVSASGNIGIFFGADGISGNVKDGGSNLTSAANTRYSWIALQVDPTTKAAYLRLFYDDEVNGGGTLESHSDSKMPLNDTPENATKYGIDGVSDVELKVEFTKNGTIKAYINGVSVISRSFSSGNARPTFGSEYGMMVLNSNYGSGKANAEVGYVKSFSATSNISKFYNWGVRRGGSSWAAADGGEFLWKYVADGTNGRTYNNLIQYHKDLEEGTVVASVAKNSRIGIAFAGTGFENVKEGSGNVAVSTAPDLKYYWAVVDWDGSAGKYYLALMTDASDADGTKTTIKKEYLTTDISTADYTIKVDFTKNGDIKVYFNNDKLIDVSGQTIYGDQLGMITTARGPLAGKAGQTAGTVKSFEISAPAAETGDSTSIYFVLSALALCMTLTGAYIFRKKRITD